MPRYNSILETIGNTPVVRLNHMAPEQVNLFVKLEYFNPMASVKDRMAFAMIEHAEETGALKPGQTVIEATSGNTGIGLAMVCAQKGYPLVVTMMESASVERRKLLRFLGAKVVLTPAEDKGTGMMRKAEELANKHDYFLTRQFANEINAKVHALTTAQEILTDFMDMPLDYWVSGFGTGGTVKGVASVLKVQSPSTSIVVAEPDNARLLGSAIPQKRDEFGEPAGSHPFFRPHPMQGWTPDFISPLLEKAIKEGWIDRSLGISGSAALETSRQLACREGIFAGITAGATVAAGLEIAQEAAPGSNILCMVPDTGERYLSTPLFEDIPTEMTAAELEISRSTPLCQFAVEAADSPAVVNLQPTPKPNVRKEVSALVEETIRTEPVVLFGMEWCEFCWAAEKLFRALDITYHSIQVDSEALQENGVGNEIRKELKALTGSPTIPQIYIGGKLVGGNSELFAAFSSGSLQRDLLELGIPFNDKTDLDSESLLPKWLQPRESA